MSHVSKGSEKDVSGVMKTYRLTERVTVTREYIIDATSKDDAIDKMYSGECEPTEVEEEDMNGIEIAVVKKRKGAY